MRNCKERGKGKNMVREEKEYKSKKCRHIKLIKIEEEWKNGREILGNNTRAKKCE